MNPRQRAILLVGTLICLPLLLAGTVLPRPVNWIVILFGSCGLIVAVLRLARLWPFPSGLFPQSNFTRRNLPSGRPASPSAASPSESIQRQVKGPAIGLVVTAILNWLAILLIFLVTGAVAARGVFFSRPPVLAKGEIVLVFSGLLLSGIMLAAGLMMKRLGAYGLAVAGAILAILVIPGNLIGLPIGIWALVVLSRREVREAFGKGHPAPRLAPRQPGRNGGAWKGVAVIVAAVMLMLAIPVGAIFLAMWVPVYQRTQQRARLVQQQMRQPALRLRGRPAAKQGSEVLFLGITNTVVGGSMGTFRVVNHGPGEIVLWQPPVLDTEGFHKLRRAEQLHRNPHREWGSYHSRDAHSKTEHTLESRILLRLGGLERQVRAI